MMSSFTQRTITFISEGQHCHAWYYVPDGLKPLEKRPAIVMAHGWGSVKEMFLAHHAEAFAREGFVVLVFDYRGFAHSEGEPRQQIIPKEQQTDYKNAISYLTKQPEVDTNRIGIWGTSYSGGHVLQIAAEDRRVKAVVALVPVTDASKVPQHWMRSGWGKAVWAGLLALLRQVIKPFKVVYVPIVNKSLQEASLPGEEAYRWLMHAAEVAPTWKNRLTARSGWEAMWYRPGKFVSRIAPTPLLFIVADRDDIVVTQEQLKTFKNAGTPSELLRVSGGHFDFYEEPGLSKVLPAQISWFRHYLRLDDGHGHSGPGGHNGHYGQKKELN
jgi:pimeloyl-ACP methyl ester carboxylesterase